ncbi:MAG: N-6 DNA methylase [Verrucomicrobiota bacterium]
MNLKAELQNYGVSHRSVRTFGTSTQADLLDYLDLIEPRGPQGVFPDGVAESQGRPLLFFVNESRLAQSPTEKEVQLQNMRRSLACRGDRAYLARIRPGELLVTPVSLTDRTFHWQPYKPGSGEALTFFSRLALGHYDGKGKPDDADFIFKEMLRVLESGIDRITKQIGWTDVLSLVGRALFFRFLRDRQIVTEDDKVRIAPKADALLACFDNAQNAYDTCRWLDKTFNGDFLPLSDGGNRAFFDNIAHRSKLVFDHLRAIVHGLEPIGANDYQTRLKLKWSDFDFAHIPIGLLSQVYEAFCWKWDPTAGETSVHYTPRNIAATLVDEVFDQLPNAHQARVLDPACGASVFLVLALRRLYRERWKHDGKRPGTKVIRELLEKKITGFDISDSALKLSALSLYLTAIELDPKPIPPEGLKFRSLRNRVLFSTRGVKDPKTGIVIGSLGSRIGKRFDGQFDLILSNPPWTSIPKKQVTEKTKEEADHLETVAEALDKVSKAVIGRKHEALAKEYRNPDRVPDLPFLWKSTEWCKPDGRIAMALPTRILFKQEEIPHRACETIFRLIEVTGIINGSNLSDTEVWPGMSQPFMLMFARNRVPKPSHTVSFITPHYDIVLNREGEFRIDSKSAHRLEVGVALEESWLWKTLAVGTSLDVEVVRKLKSIGGHPLREYWETDLKLVSSNGYQVKEKQTQKDAKPLKILPNLDSTELFRFVVDANSLAMFSRNTAFRPRLRKRDKDKLRVFRGPLTLVKEAPGADRTKGWALLSFSDVAYSESFNGYSAAGHNYPEMLVRYLHLFVHSFVWLHYALMTSPKFGAERRRFYKADLDECPFIPLEKLSNEQRNTAIGLSKRLVSEDHDVFEDIDAFFGNLYDLDEFDREVIRDTISVSLPYDESRDRACTPPIPFEREVFRRRLETVLRPFLKVLGKQPHVTAWKPTNAFLKTNAPFGILFIGEKGHTVAASDELSQELIVSLANDTGCTRIIQKVDGGLLVGILSQYRYWTPSRARLLGAEIVRQHMSVFED